MDYEKKYKEALEKARQLCVYPTTKPFISDLQDLFPELKESEDERIRKALIKYFTLSDEHAYNEACGVSYRDIVAWLEKQGDHSIYNVPSREVILAIWDLGNEWKELTNGCISTEYGTQLDYIQKHWQESEYYLRAKQGEHKPQRIISAEAKEAMYGKTAWSEEDEERLQSCLNILQAKGLMGVTDTVNSKWLKSLKDRVQSQPKQEENKRNLGGISSNWSEEDENEVAILESYIRSGEWSESHIDRALGIVDELVNKCKSSKDRVQPKQEWSEEDEKIFNGIILRCKKYGNQEQIDWLKSLRPQKQWKPSEKQMEALKEACDEHWEPDGLDPLYTLYQELKKLREK